MTEWLIGSAIGGLGVLAWLALSVAVRHADDAIDAFMKEDE